MRGLVRIWLDMANSPHPVFFAALLPELERRGHSVEVTTRAHGQTLALTHAVWPSATVVGSESPSGRVAKGAAIGRRIAELVRSEPSRRADVAVSLNSYAQVCAARVRNIPSVTLMDYEFQPANHLAFRLASRVVVPDAFPVDRLRRYGATRRRTTSFAGFKEEFYLDRPAAAIADLLWSGGGTRALLRPPAEGALYHRGANAHFDAIIERAASDPQVEVVVLPRLTEHRRRYGRMNGISLAPDRLDGLAALRSCDVFIGAGGTMSREAALLNVRAYTVFQGRLPAVDQALFDAGRLRDLRSLDPESVNWSPREQVSPDTDSPSERAAALRSWFADVIERTAGRLDHTR